MKLHGYEDVRAAALAEAALKATPQELRGMAVFQAEWHGHGIVSRSLLTQTENP
jgi:hypothetical protein